MARYPSDIKDWHKGLLEDQDRRVEERRRLPFAEKLRILDAMMAEWPLKVENVDEDEKEVLDGIHAQDD